jgi:hypothetical protein
MRICTDKTGKLIEMQSHADVGTLIKNAISSGYKEGELIEREVTEKEWMDIIASLPKPTAEKSKVDALADALIKKGTITKADIDASRSKV